MEKGFLKGCEKEYEKFFAYKGEGLSPHHDRVFKTRFDDQQYGQVIMVDLPYGAEVIRREVVCSLDRVGRNTQQFLPIPSP